MMYRLRCWLLGWHSWVRHEVSTGFVGAGPLRYLASILLFAVPFGGSFLATGWLRILCIIMAILCFRIMVFAASRDFHGDFDGTCIYCHKHVFYHTQQKKREIKRKKLAAIARAVFEKQCVNGSADHES